MLYFACSLGGVFFLFKPNIWLIWYFLRIFVEAKLKRLDYNLT